MPNSSRNGIKKEDEDMDEIQPHLPSGRCTRSQTGVNQASEKAMPSRSCSASKLKHEEISQAEPLAGKRRRSASGAKAVIVKVEKVKEEDDVILMEESQEEPAGNKRRAQKERGTAQQAKQKKRKVQARVNAFFPKVIDVDKDGEGGKNKPAKKKGSKTQARLSDFLQNNDSKGKKKSAKKIKEDPVGTRYFTCYWAPHERKLFSGVGQSGPRGVHLTGGNAKRSSHTKLQAGDVYFPVTMNKNQLFILGRLRVEAMVKPCFVPNYEQWHTTRNLPMIGGCYSPQVMIETEPEAWAGTDGRAFGRMADLRWLRPNGQERALTDPDNPRYVSTALQGVYRLAPESAKMMTELLT